MEIKDVKELLKNFIINDLKDEIKTDDIGFAFDRNIVFCGARYEDYTECFMYEYKSGYLFLIDRWTF